jgi:hypothetical protein
MKLSEGSSSGGGHGSHERTVKKGGMAHGND